MSEPTASRMPPRPSRPDIDLRGQLSSTLMSQGPRPLCVPIALSLAHEALDGSAQAVDPRKAPEAIWWYCAQRGQTHPEGMSLNHAGAALRESGQPPLSQWAWNPDLGYGTEDPPSAAGPPPWRRARSFIFSPAHDGVEDKIEETLAAGYPLVLIIEITPEFEHPHLDGSIDVPDIRNPAGDYHAVLVVGAASSSAGGRRLLIRNSWSLAWGASGYGWLPLDYLVANALQAAVLVNVQA